MAAGVRQVCSKPALVQCSVAMSVTGLQVTSRRSWPRFSAQLRRLAFRRCKSLDKNDGHTWLDVDRLRPNETTHTTLGRLDVDCHWEEAFMRAV